MDQILNEDYLVVLSRLDNGSVDMVITDPPYNVTVCAWDKAISLPSFWAEIRRVLKPSGVAVVTGVQPFTTDVINACRDLFKYEVIWSKSNGTGWLSAKKRPLRAHENVLIFYDGFQYITLSLL